MRTIALLMLMTSGCASYRAQMKAADEQDAALKAQATRDAQLAAERHQAAVQQEMAYDAKCMQPPDQAWRDFCEARSRLISQRDQREQWQRQNDIEAHRLEIEQQELDLAEREHSRQVGRDISDAINAPYKNANRPVICSTTTAGGISTTNCR